MASNQYIYCFKSLKALYYTNVNCFKFTIAQPNLIKIHDKNITLLNPDMLERGLKYE